MPHCSPISSVHSVRFRSLSGRMEYPISRHPPSRYRVFPILAREGAAGALCLRKGDRAKGFLLEPLSNHWNSSPAWHGMSNIYMHFVSSGILLGTAVKEERWEETDNGRPLHHLRVLFQKWNIYLWIRKIPAWEHGGLGSTRLLWDY